MVEVMGLFSLAQVSWPTDQLTQKLYSEDQWRYDPDWRVKNRLNAKCQNTALVFIPPWWLILWTGCSLDSNQTLQCTITLYVCLQLQEPFVWTRFYWAACSHRDGKAFSHSFRISLSDLLILWTMNVDRLGTTETNLSQINTWTEMSNFNHIFYILWAFASIISHLAPSSSWHLTREWLNCFLNARSPTIHSWWKLEMWEFLNTKTLTCIDAVTAHNCRHKITSNCWVSCLSWTITL